jgi:hypothetical protein
MIVKIESFNKEKDEKMRNSLEKHALREPHHDDAFFLDLIANVFFFFFSTIATTNYSPERRYRLFSG